MGVFVRGIRCGAGGLVCWHVVHTLQCFSTSLPCSPSMLPGEVAPMCDLALDVQHLGHHDSEGVPASVDWPGG